MNVRIKEPSVDVYDAGVVIAQHHNQVIPCHMQRDTAHGRGYDHKWRKLRRLWLLNHPLCRFCAEADRVTAATVVDHIIPHKGDPVLFYDETNLQSLCEECHNGTKKIEEHHGYSPAVGLDGWPLDQAHPVNKGNNNKDM